jgi:type II secretory pathway pseudopilin PulG
LSPLRVTATVKKHPEKREAGFGRRENSDAAAKWQLAWRKDFDAVEILLVIAIIGVVAAVIITSGLRFLETTTVRAARAELGNVKTAALAYYGQNGGWPADSRALMPWIGGTSKAIYVFDDATGLVTAVFATTWSGINWSPPPGPPYGQDGTWNR